MPSIWRRKKNAGILLVAMVGGEHCSRRHSWVSESQTVANLANSNLKKCDVCCVQIYVYLMMVRYWGNHTTKIFPLDPNPKCNTWKMFIPMYVQRVQFLESSKQILPGLIKQLLILIWICWITSIWVGWAFARLPPGPSKDPYRDSSPSQCVPYSNLKETRN